MHSRKTELTILNAVRTFTSVIRWPKLVRGIRVLTGEVGMTTSSWQENVKDYIDCLFISGQDSSFKYHWELRYSPQCPGCQGTLTQYIEVPGDVTYLRLCPITRMDTREWPMGWCCMGGAEICSPQQQLCAFLSFSRKRAKCHRLCFLHGFSSTQVETNKRAT